MAAQRPSSNNAGRPGPPYKPPVGNSTIKGSPGLLTSSGGLFGSGYQLLMPMFDGIFNKVYFALIDPSNSDTEEAAFYTYRQEDVMPNRSVSVHLLIITYRELGPATFTVGVQTYIEEEDSYKTSSRIVKIAPRPAKKGKPSTFPDKLLHTKKVNIEVISGQRPQPFWSRLANSGPVAITRMMMVGHADEKDLI
jgi:hypothetical protein